MAGWKTVLFAFAVLILGVLQSTGFNDFLSTAGLQGNGILTSAIGFIVLILRWFTSTPIGKDTK